MSKTQDEINKDCVAVMHELLGSYTKGCAFDDCYHTWAAKALGTYDPNHQYDHPPDKDCHRCLKAHFR